MSSRPDHLYDFVCIVCEGRWDSLPQDAQEISHTRLSRITTYKFGGEYHQIKRVKKLQENHE